MKIVYTSPAFFEEGGILGGGERYAYDLARYMARRADTTLLAFGSKRLDYQIDELKIKLFPAYSFHNNNRANPLISNLEWLEELRRADIVHCFQKKVDVTAYATRYALNFGCKVFISDLGGGGLDLLDRFQLTRHVDGWLPISQFGVRFLPPQSLHEVIYGGIDVDFFTPLQPIKKRSNRICYVGRLLPHKGIDNLVQAITPEMELHLVGQPYDDRYLAYLKDLAEGKRVEFIHSADDKGLRAEYNAAAVSVLPSVYIDVYGQAYNQPELLGLVLLEAQSCGTPVVATKVASLPEVLKEGETGFLAEPNDPLSLRRALQKLLTMPDEQYQGFSQTAREWVLANFTWERTVERCLKVYQAAYQTPIAFYETERTTNQEGKASPTFNLIEQAAARLSNSCDVLMITNLFPSHYIGGYEVMCHDSVRTFEREGLKVIVLTSTYGLEQPNVEDNVLRLLQHDINTEGDAIQISDRVDYFYNAAVLERCLAVFKPRQAILFNTFGINSNAILETLQKVAIPRLLHLSDFHFSPYWNEGLSEPKRLMELLKDPNLILTSVSKVNSAVYINAGLKPESLHFVPNAVDLSLLEAVPRHHPHTTDFTAEHPLKLLYVGRLVENKGSHLVVEAIIELWQKAQAYVSLDLIGTGNAKYVAKIKKEIAEAARYLGQNLPIRWLGFMQHDEVLANFHKYDAFVLSSTSERPEPFGIVVIEAMALGVPVIASYCSAAAEIIEYGAIGLITKSEKPEAFAACLRQLYQKPSLRQELSRRGQQVVLERYSTIAMNRRFLELLEKQANL